MKLIRFIVLIFILSSTTSIFAYQEDIQPKIGSDRSYIILAEDRKHERAVIVSRILNPQKEEWQIDKPKYLLSLQIMDLKNPARRQTLKGFEMWNGGRVCFKNGDRISLYEKVHEEWKDTWCDGGPDLPLGIEIQWSVEGAILFIEEFAPIKSRYHFYKLEEDGFFRKYKLPNLRLKIEETLSKFKYIEQPWRKFYELEVHSDLDFQEIPDYYALNDYPENTLKVDFYSDEITVGEITFNLTPFKKEKRPEDEQIVSFGIRIDLKFDEENHRIQFDKITQKIFKIGRY